ncbi:MAG: amidohydrolase family protein [Planctomycetota bacterium]
MRATLLILQTLFAVALATSAPAQKAPAPSDYAVHCGRLLIGDGTTSLEGAWLIVSEGKIKSVGKEQPPPELPIVDCMQRVVMPGIVAVDSDLSGARDDEYAITPDFMALDGFDFEASQRDALQGGVTTVYLSPGRERLISGQGAAVKTHGTDIVQRVLIDATGLRTNFGDGGVNAPRVFEPTAHPTDDDPLVPARIQTPTARIGVLPELRALFKDAMTDTGLNDENKGERRYDTAALKAVVERRLLLRAAATKATDIRRALLLQQELAVRMVLENPQEIATLAKQAASQQVTATFRMPVLLGRINPGTEDRLVEQQELHFDAPAKAAAAGMRIGLAPALSMPLRDYLVSVGLAVRAGLPASTALRAIGQDAAMILGVDARVGTIAAGKDADFIVLSGEPLAIGTMVEATYVDGHLAYERKPENKLLAIRCGKILDGEGRTLHNGVLLVQGNRIKGLGEDLAIPYGARVIDCPGAVMTPGFIDAWSNLGLAGEGTGVPPGTPSQKLEQVIAFDDPMFAAVLAAGVTTVLTSGKDGGPIAGRITAIKTGARNQQGLVVSSIAGQRAAFDAIGPNADQPLREMIDRAKKYTEAFTAYDKAYAEWQAGKKPVAAPAPLPIKPAPADAPMADQVSGTWEGSLELQGRSQIKFSLALKLEGQKVTGKAKLSFGTRDLPEQDVENGTFDGTKLKLEFRGMGGNSTLEGTVKDDSFDGKIAFGPAGDQSLTMKRTAKDGATTAAPIASAPQNVGEPKSDAPKKPPIDESQEPMRAILEKRAALVIRVQRGLAIQSVVTLMEKEQLPYVLQDADSAIDDKAVFGGKRPTMLLDPEMVRDEGKRLVNKAAEFADLDLPVMFGSGDCTGGRFLPLHAAYAVRYGLSPDDALAGLTVNAARAFKLEARVGSLKKGKDADFVVFSGDPFEPQSRVLLVACNGEIAIDRREEAK